MQHDNDMDYSHLNSRDRKRVAALHKRATHLSQRVATSPKRLTYDETELDALLWVLSYVANVREDGV